MMVNISGVLKEVVSELKSLSNRSQMLAAATSAQTTTDPVTCKDQVQI